MEELILRYGQLTQGLGRLKYMVGCFTELSQQSTNSAGGDNEYIVHRDALIKRFEFCYDLFWKYCKIVLKKSYGIDVMSPRKVFQACYQQNIFNDAEMENLIEMIDARNETAHVYSEESAQSISIKIIEYYKILAHLADRVAPDVSACYTHE